MGRPSISWLIADTHFFHRTMNIKCGWPENFEYTIIKKCSHLVMSQDTLFHLGDVIFYQMGKLKHLLDKIPGKKILLRGNHDKKSNCWYTRNGFSFVADQIVLGSTILSHKPIQTFSDNVRLNIHGHCHEKECTESWYSKNSYCKLDPVSMRFGTTRLIDVENQYG